MNKWIPLCLLGIAVMACDQNEPNTFLPTEHEIISAHLNLPKEVLDYSTQLPEHMIHFIPDASAGKADPQRDKLATLGRVLFYDSRLSENNKVSCATCHEQSKGFGDNMILSEGFNGEVGHRNSLALATTVGFETSYGGEESSNFGPLIQFSWDDAVPNLVEQSKLAIESEVEMGMSMDAVVDRLNQEEFYPILFNNAFGSASIDSEKILTALEAFVNTIASVDTKFDRALDEAAMPDPFGHIPSFSELENQGLHLFNNHCSSCHGFNHGVSFQPVSNNGLDEVYEDNGKGAKTHNEWEMGVFKIPFLRNIALTAPYMHDGRFATLEEVIDHYSEGIQNHPNLGTELRTFSPEKPEGEPLLMHFNDEQKSALIAYLHTLTDLNLAEDPRFSNPFK